MQSATEIDLAYLNRINCNTEAQLQILTPLRPIRLRTRLIGIDPDNAIILALGQDKYWQAAQEYITQGQGVVVRLINSDDPEANILAFRSQIKTLLNHAGRWLVVKYPKTLQSVALRQHSRIPVNVPASIHEHQAESESPLLCSSGFLQDISIKGGAYIGNEIEGGTLNKTYLLQVKLTQSEETLSVPIILKNIQPPGVGRQQFQYGFTLDDAHMEADQQGFAQKVIINHLMQQPKS
ncbi:flagellar brake domain-containing protein [Shewanella marisflavi]|uniref:flagellar brake domain-containing protein n=1 Tax=Shewanella marisflavi TaxID=260364 RepID=UPI00200BECA2|nr:PilZ domain-containing protein [Shewanella marisflavi]MCL1042571.1 flagellar brake protein [Shewanella marisflavi]